MNHHGTQPLKSLYVALREQVGARRAVPFQLTGQSQIKVEFTLAPGGLFAVFVVDAGKIYIGRDGCGQKAANKVADVLWAAHELLEKGVVRVGGFRAHGVGVTLQDNEITS